MAVTKLKNGKYESRISFRDENNRFFSKKKRFDKKSDAKAFEVDYKRELKAIGNGTLTYKQVLDQYIEISKQHNTDKSVQEKEMIFRKYCSKLFDKYMYQIEKSAYTRIYKSIIGYDMSISSKNKVIKYIKALSKFAEDYYDIKNNAKHLQLVKKTSDDVVTFETWSLNQFNIFIAHIEDNDTRLMFKTLFFSGLRIGEAIALNKSDLQGDCLSITKSMESYSKGYKRLKTVSSRRDVQLPKWLVNELTPLKSRNGEFLFGGVKPLSRNTLQRRFDKALDDVNGIKDSRSHPERREELKRVVVPYIRIHDLRHSHATMLLDNGANIVSVSRRLGHSSIQITIDTYTHVLKKQDEKINNILDYV